MVATGGEAVDSRKRLEQAEEVRGKWESDIGGYVYESSTQVTRLLLVLYITEARD
jgi:hypothetical protein